MYFKQNQKQNQNTCKSSLFEPYDPILKKTEMKV